MTRSPRLTVPAFALAALLPACMALAQAGDGGGPPEGAFGPEAWQAVQDGVPVRTDAGFLFREIRTLRRGEEVLVDVRKGEWLHLRPQGWVHVEHVVRAGSPLKPTARRMVVVRDGARVRQGPGTGYDVVETLGSGAVVEVVTEHEGWLQLASGGYLFKELLRPEALEADEGAGQGKPWRVVATTANARSGRGTEAPVVARFAKGDEVAIVGSQDGWSEVAGVGWIRSDLLAPVPPRGRATEPARGPAPERAASEPPTLMKRWTLMDLNGVFFEVGTIDPRSAFLTTLRREMRATGVLEEDWTILRLGIAVPEGRIRFNYSPDDNTTIAIDEDGARYGNIYTRGPLERLPAHLRMMFDETTVPPGQVFEGVVLFRPTLKVDKIEEIHMFIGGRLQQLYAAE